MTGVATWFDSTRGHPTLFRGGFDMTKSSTPFTRGVKEVAR